MSVDDTTYTINFRLKDLEARLDPNKFSRFSRRTVANLEIISHVNPMPSGT
ncbi:MAG TPA: LytTR family DNA-binding domain-containing protein [Pyrinomonadaceae bacterium]|nr:LytTR family DNA-binding domain-containing protein [Pyrinomonadaceae bacterium]